MLALVRPHLPKPLTLIVVVLSFVLGLLYAYLINPVTFYDGDPAQLEQGWQEQWVRLLADRYAAFGDREAVASLLAAIDDPGDIAVNNNIGSPDFQGLAQQAQESSDAAPPRPTFFNNWVVPLLAVLVFALLVVLYSILYGLLLRPTVVEPMLNRINPERRKRTTTDAAAAAQIDSIRQNRAAQAELLKSAVSPSEFGDPVVRRLSNYRRGYGQFDDSFNVETEAGQYYGECGATIAETLGSGNVTAVEVWVFDKDEFSNTPSGLFVSDYAAADPSMTAKANGRQMVPAQVGATLTLDTGALRLVARVVTVTYATGDFPPNSVFETLGIEILVWQKGGTRGGGQPMATPTTPQPTTPIAQPTSPSQGYTPPSPTPTYTPPPAPVSGGYAPPGQGYAPPPPTAPAPRQDDDPFGGTGDFTPVR